MIAIPVTVTIAAGLALDVQSTDRFGTKYRKVPLCKMTLRFLHAGQSRERVQLLLFEHEPT